MPYRSFTFWQESKVTVTLNSPTYSYNELGNTDLSRCYVEVDLVAPSNVSARLRQLVYTLALHPDNYNKTVSLYLQHYDYRPLIAPLRDVCEVQVYIRNADNVPLPFYTGLVTITLHFRRRKTK